jgi:NAD(P)-dependent dehydrogenase (short-subunit alcohol dehydrogenase family)
MTKRLQGLQDKTCIITGTGGSIGRAAALRFAEEDASVVGSDTMRMQPKKRLNSCRRPGGGHDLAPSCRLTTMADCQKLVELAIREHGRIDVLFNNAGEGPFQPD